MNYKKVYEWLDEHGITLNESCPAALRRLSGIYKKENGITLLNDVYRLIGTSKQEISWWENHLVSTQTKKTINTRLFFQLRKFLI